MRVIATSVDGEAGLSNRKESVKNVYLPVSRQCLDMMCVAKLTEQQLWLDKMVSWLRMTFFYFYLIIISEKAILCI